jgi:MerR family transcriptional regulator, mercuric resistance operon regulatory protein
MTERMTIGRFAKAADVGVETVRFYQRRGLLSVPRAAGSKFREYDRELLQRLRFIKKAQTAGFTLAEIKELLTLDRTNQRQRIRAIAGRKLSELEQRIRELDGVRRSLSHLVHHCETAPAGRPCPIVVSFTDDGATHRH